MGGREARATLIFVLVSLAGGAAYREWIAPGRGDEGDPERPTFFERVRALEESAALDGPAPGDAETLARGDATIAPSSDGGGGAGANPSRRARPPESPLGRLDVDRATAAEWERLPGIGPALASRIVADRAARGPFRRPEGLLRVRGIGPKTLARLRPYLRPSPVDSTSPFAN